MKRGDFRQTESAGNFRYIPNRTYDPRKREAEQEEAIRDYSRQINIDPDLIIGVFTNFETAELETVEIDFPVGSVKCYENLDIDVWYFQRFERKYPNLLILTEIRWFQAPQFVVDKVKQEIRQGWKPNPNDLTHHQKLWDQYKYSVKKELIESIDFFERRSGKTIPNSIFLNRLKDFEL